MPICFPKNDSGCLRYGKKMNPPSKRQEGCGPVEELGGGGAWAVFRWLSGGALGRSGRMARLQMRWSGAGRGLVVAMAAGKAGRRQQEPTGLASGRRANGGQQMAEGPVGAGGSQRVGPVAAETNRSGLPYGSRTIRCSTSAKKPTRKRFYFLKLFFLLPFLIFLIFFFN